jgi:hypothetical protein
MIMIIIVIIITLLLLLLMLLAFQAAIRARCFAATSQSLSSTQSVLTFLNGGGQSPSDFNASSLTKSFQDALVSL